MAMLARVLLLAVAVTSVFADTSFTFPEVARGFGSRIVSGWEAYDGQFPYQLSIRMVNRNGGVTACGGTIIHSEWGLTAAHCTATRETFVIRAGTCNLTMPAAIFETTKFYNHPDYNNAMQSVVQPHDIGLLEFGRILIFSDLIQPIRIQSSLDQNRNYDTVRATASGWGNTWSSGSSPEILNWVYLLLTSNQECRRVYNHSPIIVDSTICARSYNVSSQSTCQGDSGGPLVVVDDDGDYTQVGVTSFVSATGCHTDIPAGFIQPGFYHDWFTEVTGINFDWENVGPTTVNPEDDATIPDSDSEEVTSPDESPEDDESNEDVTTPAPIPDDTTTPASEESSESSETSESSESSESEESVSSSEED